MPQFVNNQIKENCMFLDDFALRCFRDVADQDYVSARLSHRACLIPQFLWQGQQALEKYIKSILLLNRIPARNMRHSLRDGLTLLKKLPFRVGLSESSHELIDYIDKYGRFRYFDVPWQVRGNELFLLDRAIWELRRYCHSVNSVFLDGDGKYVHDFEYELVRIKLSKYHSPNEFSIVGGELEKILANKMHPARAPLVWKNFYFSTRAKRKIKASMRMWAANPPLVFKPELVSEFGKYVHIPAEVKQVYHDWPRD